MFNGKLRASRPKRSVVSTVITTVFIAFLVSCGGGGTQVTVEPPETTRLSFPAFRGIPRVRIKGTSGYIEGTQQKLGCTDHRSASVEVEMEVAVDYRNGAPVYDWRPITNAKIPIPTSQGVITYKLIDAFSLGLGTYGLHAQNGTFQFAYDADDYPNGTYDMKATVGVNEGALAAWVAVNFFGIDLSEADTIINVNVDGGSDGIGEFVSGLGIGGLIGYALLTAPCPEGSAGYKETINCPGNTNPGPGPGPGPGDLTLSVSKSFNGELCFGEDLILTASANMAGATFNHQVIHGSGSVSPATGSQATFTAGQQAGTNKVVTTATASGKTATFTTTIMVVDCGGGPGGDCQVNVTGVSAGNMGTSITLNITSNTSWTLTANRNVEWLDGQSGSGNATRHIKLPVITAAEDEVLVTITGTGECSDVTDNHSIRIVNPDFNPGGDIWIDIVSGPTTTSRDNAVIGPFHAEYSAPGYPNPEIDWLIIQGPSGAQTEPLGNPPFVDMQLRYETQGFYWIQAALFGSHQDLVDLKPALDTDDWEVNTSMKGSSSTADLRNGILAGKYRVWSMHHKRYLTTQEALRIYSTL